MPKARRKNIFAPVVITRVDRALQVVTIIISAIYLLLPFFLLVIFALTAVATTLRFSWGVEAMGNVILISGAVLIASGTVLSADMKEFLLTVRKQEQLSPTHYLRQTHLLRFALRAIRLHNKGWSPLKIRKLYRRQHRRITTPGGERLYLTQDLAADLLLRSSNRAEAGTFLIVIGTLILWVHSL